MPNNNSTLEDVLRSIIKIHANSIAKEEAFLKWELTNYRQLCGLINSTPEDAITLPLLLEDRDRQRKQVYRTRAKLKRMRTLQKALKVQFSNRLYPQWQNRPTLKVET